VINMRNYESYSRVKLKERVWSEKDVEELTKTLAYLEFRLVIRQNLTKPQLMATLEEQASLDHSNSDCFLCVVMSHGNENEAIYASDGQEISFEEIMAPIKSCASLFNKPKMFFFQACRGHCQMIFYQEPKAAPRYKERTKKTTAIKSDPIVVKRQVSSHYESDLLVFNATLPNNLAWSISSSQGTIFIQSLCQVFNEAYRNLPSNLSMSQIITKIKQKVKEQKRQLIG